MNYLSTDAAILFIEVRPIDYYRDDLHARPAVQGHMLVLALEAASSIGKSMIVFKNGRDFHLSNCPKTLISWWAKPRALQYGSMWYTCTENSPLDFQYSQ